MIRGPARPVAVPPLQHQRPNMPPGSPMQWPPGPGQARPGQARSAPGKPGKPRGGFGAARKRPLWLSLLKWGVLAGLFAGALLVATAAFVFWMFGRDPNLPDYKQLSDYRPKQVSIVLDGNDRRIGEIYTERRTYVPYEKVPPIVFDAFVAAEDNKFWTHAGVDYVGMFRAFIANLRAGKTKQGASTITQQVVKTFLLTPERTFRRKIQEIIIARRLEKALTKQEILTLYVNQIYFGHRRYGIQEAARYYFGKDVEKLNVGEAAVLGSMPKEPEILANSLHGKKPERAKERQIYVLNQLVAIGKLSREEAQKWIDAPIQVVKEPFPDLGIAPEWVEVAREELIKDKGEAGLDSLGATVRTTLDPSLQTIAQRALQAGLRKVDQRQRIGRPHRSVKPDKIADEVARLGKRLGKGGPQAKEVYDAVVTEVFDADQEVVVDLGGWKGALVLGTPEDARFNPVVDGATKRPGERFKPGDVVEVTVGASELVAATHDDADEPKRKTGPTHAPHRVAFAPAPQGAVVIIENRTRKVRAMVGGYALKAGDRNRALKAHRQPGSSFKPFVYAAAIDSGKYTPATTVNDAPEVFDLWKPKNYESGKFEGPVLLRHALKKSINTVAIRVTYDLKPETIAALAHKMGIVSELPREMSLALGSGEVTPFEMTNAIATLAAGGKAQPARFIEAVDGKALPAPASEQVLRPEVAYVVVDMMRSVVTEGTAQAANKLGIPVAGKTGTSNEGRDVWFMGMTADYTIGVWIGYDQPKSLGKGETGGTTAVPVFVDVVAAMGQPAKAFPRPPGVVEVTIDKLTGLVAPDGAPKGTTRSEVFVEGSQPTEVAAMPGDVTGDNVVTDEYAD